MSLDLGIGQLLMKKIVVREFLVESPEIELRREADGEWRFLSYASNDSPIASATKFLVLGKVVVTDGKIIVIDESPREIVRGAFGHRLTRPDRGAGPACIRAANRPAFDPNAVLAALEVTVIKAGEVAPSWSGEAGGGKTLRSDDYRGKKHVILYFFPKDFTPG